MRTEEILRRPIALTEKASRLRETNQVIFEVARAATKIQIKNAVEKMFGVQVAGVNTLIVRGKVKRMGRGHGKLQNWKKAIVTLAEGQSIDFFADQGSASAST